MPLNPHQLHHTLKSDANDSTMHHSFGALFRWIILWLLKYRGDDG